MRVVARATVPAAARCVRQDLPDWQRTCCCTQRGRGRRAATATTTTAALRPSYAVAHTSMPMQSKGSADSLNAPAGPQRTSLLNAGDVADELRLKVESSRRPYDVPLRCEWGACGAGNVGEDAGRRRRHRAAQTTRTSRLRTRRQTR